jgi:hypothetical protein
MHGLGDDEPKVVGEPLGNPFPPVPFGIGVTQRGLHPDFAVAQFDQERRYVVRCV